MTTIRLPWPPRDLTAHANGMWWHKSKPTAKYRQWAYLAALEAKVTRNPNAVLRFTYNPPDRRRRDLHNLHGAPAKAAIDGIAQAMGCDDRDFICHFPTAFGPVVKGGQVLVEVSK